MAQMGWITVGQECWAVDLEKMAEVRFEMGLAEKAAVRFETDLAEKAAVRQKKTPAGL